MNNMIESLCWKRLNKTDKCIKLRAWNPDRPDHREAHHAPEMPQHPRDRILGHWASSKRPSGIIIFHMGCPTTMPSSVGRGALNVSSGLLGPSPTRLSPPPIRPVSFLCNRVATGVSMSSVLWVHTNRHHVGAGTRGPPTHINLWFWNLCTWFLKVHYCLFIFFTVFFDPKEVGCVQIKSFGPKSHLLKGNYTVWNYIFWAWTYEENKFLKPSRHEVFLKISCWLSSSLTPNAF